MRLLEEKASETPYLSHTEFQRFIEPSSSEEGFDELVDLMIMEYGDVSEGVVMEVAKELGQEVWEGEARDLVAKIKAHQSAKDHRV